MSLNDILNEQGLYLSGQCSARILEREQRKENQNGSHQTNTSFIDHSRKFSNGDAFLATLPFTLFGIASMIGKLDLPFHVGYICLLLYAIFLIGMLIGLITIAPRWIYSYLGWSIVLAWWWTGVKTPGMKILGYRMDDWDWQLWISFLTIFVIVLIWTRSLTPLIRLVKGVWQEWTLLSLAMYVVVAFLFLSYDENHSLYLIAFMIASTLAISVGVWVS